MLNFFKFEYEADMQAANYLKSKDKILDYITTLEYIELFKETIAFSGSVRVSPGSSEAVTDVNHNLYQNRFAKILQFANFICSFEIHSYIHPTITERKNNLLQISSL
jgi:hypothetical protein